MDALTLLHRMLICYTEEKLWELIGEEWCRDTCCIDDGYWITLDPEEYPHKLLLQLNYFDILDQKTNRPRYEIGVKPHRRTELASPYYP